jgi:hypothetical protein
MVNDDKSLLNDDSILSCDIKTNDNLCMLVAVYNSLRTIEERIAFSGKNLKESLKHSLDFLNLIKYLNFVNTDFYFKNPMDVIS